MRILHEDEWRQLRGVLLSKLREQARTRVDADPAGLQLAERGVPGDYLLTWLKEQKVITVGRHHIREFFYELSRAGIGYFGPGDHFYFCERALPLLQQDATLASPLDQAGYLESLLTRHPDLDQIIREYLAEAVQAVNSGCVRSAVICLGAASETFVLELGSVVEAWRDAKAAQGRRPPPKADEKISAVINRVVDVLRQNKPALQSLNIVSPDDWTRRFERIADMIRWSRNDAGHPSHVAVDRFGAWEGLVIFHQILLEGWELHSKLRSDTP